LFIDLACRHSSIFTRSWQEGDGLAGCIPGGIECILQGDKELLLEYSLFAPVVDSVKHILGPISLYVKTGTSTAAHRDGSNDGQLAANWSFGALC
jgi:hypothetical protein